METKEMISFLRTNGGNAFMLTAETAKEIADQLEGLKKENKTLKFNNQKLVKQLSEQPKPQTEWISVEDRLPEDRQSVLVYDNSCKKISCVTYIKEYGFTPVDDYWMPPPEPPKPKAPTFKDVFLKACHSARLDEDGLPVACRCDIYLYSETDGCQGEDGENCGWCWNQPYFEEEGEMDA